MKLAQFHGGAIGATIKLEAGSREEIVVEIGGKPFCNAIPGIVMKTHGNGRGNMQKVGTPPMALFRGKHIGKLFLFFKFSVY